MAPRRQRVKAKVGELTAEYYLGKLNELAKAKPTPKKHAPTTMELIKSVEKRWQSHCALIKKDPDHHLRECNPEIYKKFLHWVLNSCRVMKYSSIYQYWRTMKAIYRKNIGEHIDAIVNEEVFNYIKEPLVEEFNLDLSVRDKPVMSVNDLVSVLHYHWALDTATYPNE
ncbi:MAG: hypothetical protein M1840_006998 [Geoglossum simile]|nr:MAG: hypothetical protein M1840_006998 [Geoglossum simile]